MTYAISASLMGGSSSSKDPLIIPIIAIIPIMRQLRQLPSLFPRLHRINRHQLGANVLRL